MSNILVQNIKHTNNTTSMTVDSSGQVTIRGESSATTTNLQQGLAKGFLSATVPGSVGDSFNVSGTTDAGTGKHTVALSNNMNATSHAVVAACQDAEITSLHEDFRATTGYQQTMFTRVDTLGRADGDHFSAIFGDLA
tara:strand:- start:431 stop:844 length:414 start_codon:yes stop_codon:yes gene_type:complete